MKRSQETYSFHYNNAFQAYKTCRGTTMYYQDTKKKLMATLRQKGAPTLFTTFSCAEYEWEGLCKSIYETVNKTKVSIDFIKQKSPSWKNKLISENVTQSTLHFNKRTEKLMSILSNKGMFTHHGRNFRTDSYFYRVEFQQRGAPTFIAFYGLKMKMETSHLQCGMMITSVKKNLIHKLLILLI